MQNILPYSFIRFLFFFRKRNIQSFFGMLHKMTRKEEYAIVHHSRRDLFFFIRNSFQKHSFFFSQSTYMK